MSREDMIGNVKEYLELLDNKICLDTLKCYLTLILLDDEQANNYIIKCKDLFENSNYDTKVFWFYLYTYYKRHYRFYEAVQALKKMKESSKGFLGFIFSSEQEISCYKKGFADYLLADLYYQMENFQQFQIYRRMAAAANEFYGLALERPIPAPATNNRICVYAITKNEEKFVDRWYESMKQADEIVVLDTGSTDSTVDKLRAYGVRVEVQQVKPWRFDEARNISLSLVPLDCNILICTDLDQTLQPGWAKAIRDNWIDGKHKRGFYKYTWSHLEDGSNGRTFVYDKLHSRGWWWRFPVHEMLFYLDNDIETNLIEQGIDLCDNGVHLHHYPDPFKSRGSYLPLLELRAKESPQDWYGLIYLAHEYCYRGYYQKSINLLTKILTDYSDHYSNLQQASCYLFIGDDYMKLNNLKLAEENYKKAIEIDNTYRQPYIGLAKALFDQGNYNDSQDVLINGLKNSYRHYTWLERDTSWTWQPYDMLCLAYFYDGNPRQSALYAAKALLYEPTNERLFNNLKLCIQAIDNIA